MYFSIPLFAAVREDYRKSVFIYLAVASFILNALIPFICTVSHYDVGYSLNVAAVSGYLIYLLIGYLLHKNEVKVRYRIMIYIAGVAGLLMHTIGTYVLSMEAGEIVRTYKGYLNVPCIMYSVSVFLFFRYGGARLMQNLCINKCINTIAGYTFALYILHWYVLRILVKEFEIDERSIYYRIGAPFLVLPIVMLLTWLIRKIPILKRVLP